ncbi:MAG: DUF1572 family protein [Terriglobia bacterium]
MCLERLGDADIWWRANPQSNSAGNLVLHLAGNARQWITSGLGGVRDVRDRNREFSETGPIAGRMLAAVLRKEVQAACRAIAGLRTEDLAAPYVIQGFRVTGLNAIDHVVEHFAYHTGQIIYLTKLRLGTDLGFTRLPRQKQPAGARSALPAI